MLKKVARVILAYKRRLVKKVKRRTPLQRLKARQYYKRHKSKIRLQRRRYMLKNRLFTKTRKLFKRTKPGWLYHKKQKAPKTHIKKKPTTGIKKHPAYKKRPSPIAKPPKVKKFKAYAPKRK